MVIDWKKNQNTVTAEVYIKISIHNMMQRKPWGQYLHTSAVRTQIFYKYNPLQIMCKCFYDINMHHEQKCK